MTSSGRKQLLSRSSTLKRRARPPNNQRCPHQQGTIYGNADTPRSSARLERSEPSWNSSALINHVKNLTGGPKHSGGGTTSGVPGGRHGRDYLDKPHETAAYNTIWADMAGRALNESRSKSLIQQVAEEYSHA